MNSMNNSDMLLSISNKSDSKLGYTTTVKDQVEQIQNNIEHFRKTLEQQRKQQNQLQYQLKKLEQQTRTSFSQTGKEIVEKVTYLSDSFKSESMAQDKQFDYLQMQNSTLNFEHDKLNELMSMIHSRTQQMENAVGLEKHG